MSTNNLIFRRGHRVEVICSGAGFQGAYYPATVLAAIDAGKFMIQYDTLLRDDELAPLREMVCSADLRPIPPPIAAERFAMKDRVDAHANDGWWSGEVVKRLPGGRGRVYRVVFEESGEVGDYRVRDLRVHQDWIHGKWYKSTSRGM